VKLSRSTRAGDHQNFLLGIAFIIVALTLAAFGEIGPITAAIYHGRRTLIVIFNSARPGRKGERTGTFSSETDPLRAFKADAEADAGRWSV